MHIYAYAYSSTYTYPFTVMLTYIQTQRGRKEKGGKRGGRKREREREIRSMIPNVDWLPGWRYETKKQKILLRCCSPAKYCWNACETPPMTFDSK